jgi:hypothetical protein
MLPTEPGAGIGQHALAAARWAPGSSSERLYEITL